ncbi:TadE family type IV pilus minor pilin [Luteipulveratus sp. YIM 133132]|uniref:TadE family type IV pilus minor pilin n=1 Tax=Luteipulveratus flavus TaxID=3031728 RepID=UPI0023AFD339|nr:TadE family type IV pilus minor pilin [Luteipulveratus sp. YIM 133132]MDE9366947.1 TadE family type IV pilus minor pilin [Luteipulveratus sp. YIM 133132]
MVSAELAAAVPAVVLVLAIALNALVIGIDQIRCADAARVAARSAARGDAAAAVEKAGRRNAPAGATVVTGGQEELVQVTVRSPVPGPFGWLLGRDELSASARAQREQAAGEGS